MTVQQMADLLNAKVLVGGEHMDRVVESACGSDLMSDVLAFVKEKTALITGLTNPHVLRTAEMLDIVCIIFARGKIPDEEMLEQAAEQDLVILCTDKTIYTTCGILYAEGLRGTERKKG